MRWTYNKDTYLKLAHYVVGRLNLRKSSQGWYRGDCPYCEGRNTFGINLETGGFHCFKACFENKKLAALIMDIDNLNSYHDVFEKAKAFDDLPFLPEHKKEHKLKPIELPESYRLLSLGDSYTAKLARNYMRKRGFKISYLSAKGVGYCTKGEYSGRIILPYYSKGKLVYFTSRQFIQAGQKFKNPKEEDFDIGKSQLIYNIDALYLYRHVRVVESVINCLTLPDNSIGLGGKNISDSQLSILISSPCKSLSLLLDPDAYFEALEFALQICHYKKVKVVKLPVGKDVNDLGKKVTLKLEKEVPFMGYTDIFKLYLNEKNTKHTYS